MSVPTMQSLYPMIWYTNQYGGENEYPQINVIVKNIDTITDVEEAIDTKLNANEKTPVIRIRMQVPGFPASPQR